MADFSARKRYGKSIDLILSQEKYIHFCQCNSLCHEKCFNYMDFEKFKRRIFHKSSNAVRFTWNSLTVLKDLAYNL